jgi:hypothetical protein
MRSLIKNKLFILGFLSGVCLFVCLNIYQIFGVEHPQCHHCVIWYGFPLPFYEKFIAECEFSTSSVAYYVGEFSLLGTISNILIIVVSSWLLGLVLRFFESKASSRILPLK